MNKQPVAMLGEMPLSRLIPKLALPTVISMVITGVYNMADSFFAARLGAAAAGGVGVVFSAFSLLQAVGYTVALGGSTWISRLLGEENEEKARTVSSATFWLSIVLGTLLGLAGFLAADSVILLLGATPAIRPFGLSYLRLVMLAAPFLCGGFAVSCILRSLGKAGAAMTGILAGSLLNVLLDPFLMFFCSMGVAGAGLATLIGQGVTFFLLLLAFLRAKSPLSFHVRWLTKKAGLYLQIIRYGMSSFFRQGMAAVGTLLLNRAAARFGDTAVAALSLAGKASAILYSAFLGWGQGYQPVAGFCYGKKDLKRIGKAFTFTLVTGTMGLTLAAVVVFILAYPIMQSLGAGEAQIAQIGRDTLRIQAIFMPFVPLGVLTNMTYQSVERPVMATLLACLRQGFCLIPLVLLLPRWIGLTGVIIAQGAADGLTFLATLPATWWLFARKKKRLSHFE